MENVEIVYENLKSSFRKSLKQTGCENVVIGISGGIDSALSAAVAVDSIGSGHVYGYYLPYSSSSQDSYSDAVKLAEKFGFHFEIVDISPVVNAFFSNNIDKVESLRKGNVMSRVRMVTLFDRASVHGAVVAGTTNRTELLLGYGTWYGDTASSINVAGGLYKREVYALSRFAGVPESIINKAPSADLWPGQTDEAEIGFSYELLDNIFYDMEQKHKSRSELDNIYGKSTMDRLLSRVARYSFKRHTPVICKTGIDGRKKIDEKLIKKLLK